TAEPGSLVIITGPGPGGTTIELGRGIAVGGNFSIALSPAQTNETTLTIVAKDAAGNVSDPTSFNVVDAPDLPDGPVITSIVDDNGAGNVEVKGTSSDDTTPTISGTGPENSTITLYQNGVEITTIVLGAGQTTWSYTVPAGSALAEGVYNF